MTKATKCLVKLFISSLDIWRRVLSLFLTYKLDEVNPPRNGRLVSSKNLNLGKILQDKPPPPLEVGSLVKILVNVDIKRILTISEVGQWSLFWQGHSWFQVTYRHPFIRWTAFLKLSRTSDLSGETHVWRCAAFFTSLHKIKFQLHNLRPLTHENTLTEAEKNNIWIPSITFANTATTVI